MTWEVDHMAKRTTKSSRTRTTSGKKAGRNVAARTRGQSDVTIGKKRGTRASSAGATKKSTSKGGRGSKSQGSRGGQAKRQQQSRNGTAATLSKAEATQHVRSFVEKTATDRTDAPAKGGTFVQESKGELRVFLRLEPLAKHAKVSVNDMRKAAIEHLGFSRKPFSYMHDGKQTSASYFSAPAKGLVPQGVPHREVQRGGGSGRAEGNGRGGRKSSRTAASRRARASSTSTRTRRTSSRKSGR
jgi:hypothetical protein